MREHFRIGIQMTGEVARGTLPGEFLVEGGDELLDGQLRSTLQHCGDQSGPLDLAVAVGLAQFIELRAGAFCALAPNRRGGLEERAKAVADLAGETRVLSFAPELTMLADAGLAACGRVVSGPTSPSMLVRNNSVIAA